MRHRLWIVGMVFVFVTGCLTSFSMAENPCSQRLFNICEKNKRAMICRLMSFDEPETVESVSVFLEKISTLDPDARNDHICARLMGRKTFLNIATVLDESPDSDGQCLFKSDIGKFSFKIDDADYFKLADAHLELENLKLCPNKEISYDAEGMVVDADVEYSESNLVSFVLRLEDVRLSNIATLYAEGGFDVQRKPLEKKIEEEYQRYFKGSGKEKGTSLKKENSKKQRPRKESDTLTNSIGMEFVKVPAGAHGSYFACDDTSGIVLIEAFHISRYEVTQGQWKAVMGNNPSHFKACGDNCPVEQVSYDDVQEFIAKMNQKGEGTYRLPTETEWEYAARAGSYSAYCFGDNESELSQYAWYYANSKNSTHLVGQLKPNHWGMYDMHGNVWEWCQDSSSGTSRVVRGGSWGYSAGYCQSAGRNRSLSGNQSRNIGFRLASSHLNIRQGEGKQGKQFEADPY